VEDPNLIKELDERKVSYSGLYESKLLANILSWVIPLAIFFFIWRYAMKRMGPGYGVMSFSKSKAKLFAENETKVTFEDVAGIDEAKEELQEVVEFLKNPGKFQKLGGRIPKGVLLLGPPGTGKTLLAKAVAGEAGVPFFSISGSEFVEMFVGVGAARVRDLFSQATSHAPCIIFVDELDALGKARGINVMGGHDEREQTLNQLLVEMDGFESNKGVIIMAATNRPEILDPALLRPGRFDRQVLVDRPDINGREAILKIHSRKVILSPEVDLKKIAARTPGFVGADLANLVNEAALLAARKNKEDVGPAEFDEAIDRVIAGLEKKKRVMSPKEKEIVAYHESGHAIVAESVEHADLVHKITIIPRGVAALGYTQQQPTEDRYLMTKSELLDRMAVLLGGRVAEELVFGEVSTGAQNDLQRATDIARSMVTEYGMSNRLGLVAYERERRSMLLPESFTPGGKTYSEEKAAEIDEEISKVVEDTHQRVRGILGEKQEVLKKLAKLLLEKEIVQGDEMRALMGKTKPAPPALPGGPKGELPSQQPAA
jgi:cell division protease FtsH